MKKRFFAYSFVMTLILLGAIYGHLHTGFSDMSTSDLIRILFGGGNDVENLTVFDFRLVRTILAVFIGPYMTVAAVWTIADIFNGLMALPNMIALFALSGVVVKETKRFFEVYADQKMAKKKSSVNRNKASEN